MNTEADAVLRKLRAVQPKQATLKHVTLGETALKSIGDSVGLPEWFELSILLATFYLELPGGERHANVARASELYRAVLAHTDDPHMQAVALNGLANAQIANPAPDRTEFIQTQAALERAIVQMEERSAPDLLASLLGTRAALLLSRPWGDRSAALEEALQLRRRAIAVLEAEPTLARSPLMGRALHNLGVTYLQQERGIRTDHINSAVVALQKALDLRPAASDPLGRASTLRMLAQAYPEWTGADSLTHGQILAEHAAAEAEQLTTRARPAGAEVQEWARFRNQISALTVDFSDLEALDAGEISDWLDSVLAIHLDALAAISAESMPIEWASWKGGEGRVLAAYYLFLGRADFLDDAFAAFEAALERTEPQVHPRLWRDLQRRKGELAHASEDWARSQEAHTAALAIGDMLYTETSTPEGRAAELRQLSGFANFGAYAAAKRGDRLAAVELAERGRARGFVDAVLAAELRLATLPGEVKERVLAARRKVVELEGRLRLEGSGPLDDVSSKLADFLGVHPETFGVRLTQDPAGQADAAANARVELAGLLNEARNELNDVLAQDEVRMAGALPERLTAGDIARLARRADAPLLYLLPTLHGTMILAVAPEDVVRTLSIEGFGSAETRSLLYGAGDRPGFLGAAMYGDPQGLARSLSVCVPMLEGLLVPVTQWVRQMGYARAFLIPLGSLGLLPLHAAAIESDVTYRLLPSARVLSNLLQRHVRASADTYSLFAIAAPQRDDLPDLPYAEAEAHLTAAAFRRQGAAVDVVASASEDALYAAAGRASHLHLACHAQFRAADPLASVIYIGHSGDLRLAELLGHQSEFAGVQLAVLSACQTAVGGAELPDESIGFPNALLTAGVRTVVSTRWPVDDRAALLFSHHFYRHIFEGRDAAEATQLTSRWLRMLTAEEIVATARAMMAALPTTATTAADTLAQVVVDFRFMGNDRPFSDWVHCAAFACHGL